MSERDVWAEVSPLGDLLVRNATLYPDRIALVLPQGRTTYRRLLDGARRVARGLWALGARPGETIGLMTGNSVEYVEAFFGIALLGCVIVPLNVRHKAAELGFIIANSDMVALLTTSDAGEYVDFADLLGSALPSLRDAPDPAALSLPEAPKLRSMVLLRGGGKPGAMDRTTFDRLAAGVDAAQVDQLRRRVRIRDVATVIYTSGTTAHPKGCLLSHEALTRGPVERASRRFAVDGPNVHWGAGPLFHIGSLGPALGILGAGGTYVTDAYYDPRRALDLMKRERVTTLWPWFHAIVQGLLDQPDFTAQKLPHLRSIVIIGPRVLAETVQARFPDAELLQGCGMTETAGIFALTERTDAAVERTTTQGKAYPGVEIRIVDLDTGDDAAPDHVGEIWVRGYCVMEGYYKEPAKTQATLDAEGWLHTGDLYRRTAHDNLVFNGRLKDMLKVGGENVAAIEVEDFLAEHPAVRLAAVIGRPDPRLDEVPVAFVETHAGAAVTAEEIIEFCRGRIANYKVPRAVHFITDAEWPRSATKIDKRGLAARLSTMPNVDTSGA